MFLSVDVVHTNSVQIKTRAGRSAPAKNERNRMTQLVKYEAAKYALQEARSVDEVKNIHDVSAAMKAYAIQAQDKQMEIDASEIRIRAERRLGEMIKTQKDTVGLATGGNYKGANQYGCGTPEERQPKDPRPTLSDVGISKKLSSRSQAIARGGAVRYADGCRAMGCAGTSISKR